MPKFNPLLNLKKTFLEMSDTEVLNYIRKLSGKRQEGTKKIVRSKATGAPKGGRSQSSAVKFNQLLESLPPEEQEKLVRKLLSGE